MRWNAVCAATTALAVRLFFIFRFPVASAATGDSMLYEQFAENWRDHGIYGFWISGQLQPVDIRVPGYPAFLNLVAFLSGRHFWPLSVEIFQALLDICACFLIAAIAARLAPEDSKRRVWAAGLWLAALCPFVANYSAALLTEVLATFITTLAIWILVNPQGITESPANQQPSGAMRDAFLLALVMGCGAMVRPEMPLLLIAVALVLLWRCRRPRNWRILIRTGALFALGVVLPLIPWAARNWLTLHEVQFLSPRYAELPGELVPRGLNAWTGTWMWRFRDVYLVPWKVNDEEIAIDNIPASAFDSQDERDRVSNILDEYNDVTTWSPEMDAGFAELAGERTARHPMRTYVQIPALRAVALWFTPRTELLPYEGKLWPVGYAWENDPVDFSVTLALWLIGVTLIALGIAGFWRVRHHPATPFLAAFVALRTAFFTHADSVEPRYVLECLPVVLTFAAQVWQKSPSTEELRSR